MDINDIKNYLNKFRQTNLDVSVLHELKALKELEVSLGNQVAAKEIWCLEQVCKVIQHYISAYKNLQNKEHFKAWCEFDRAEIELSFLRKHLNFEDNKYYLKFYDKMLFQYTKLFPYQYFMSRESIIKRASCSICGQTISLRKPCGHRLGEIYNGEQCFSTVEDIEFLAMAIVKNPFDKYTVLFPEGLEYDYTILDSLLIQLTGPYDDWDLEILKKRKQEFDRLGRNEPCPCKSGKKYKLCCRGTDNELFDHHRITLHTAVSGEIMPMKIVNTWK